MFAMSLLRNCIHKIAPFSQLISSVAACTQSICTCVIFADKTNAKYLDRNNDSNIMAFPQNRKSMRYKSTYCCHSSSCSSFRSKKPNALLSSLLSSSSYSTLFSRSSSTAITQQRQHYSTPGKVKVTITTPDYTDLDLESGCNVSLM